MYRTYEKPIFYFNRFIQDLIQETKINFII